MSIYDSISKVFEEHNVTTYRIEKDCALSHGIISKWRTSSPSVDILIKIADYLNVSLDYLVGREFPKQDGEEEC